MINKIRQHWAAIFFSVILGLLLVSSTLVAIKKIGQENFKGIYPVLSDDESHYLTMIREVSDGHLTMSNPYIEGEKDNPYTQPFIADIYYFSFSKIFGISLGATAMANDFLLPAVSFLLLYIFLYRLTYSKNFSNLFSFIFFLYFVDLFNRPVNPQFSFVFLLVGLNLIWLIVNNSIVKKAYLYNFLFALVFGILVYVYPFYWMTLVVIYSLLTLVKLWFDRKYEYWVRNWLSFSVPALLLFIPFYLNFQKLKSSILFEETTIRNGYIFTHIPGAFLSIAPLCLCIIVLAYIYYFKRVEEDSWDDNKHYLLSCSLVVGGFILNWQNIITGLTIQFTSHLYPVMVLFTIIISAISISRVEQYRLSKVVKIILYFIVVSILFFILFLQKDQFKSKFKSLFYPTDFTYLQKISYPLSWLNTNAEKDSTVFTLGKEYDWAIPVYTSSNIYFINYAGVFLMSDEELEKRWAIKHFYDVVDRSVVYGNRDIWLDRFIDTYQSKEVRRRLLQMITRKEYPHAELMSEVAVQKVLSIYEDYKKLGFEKSLKSFEVDYLMFDYTDPNYLGLKAKFDKSSFLEMEYVDEKTVIYKVK